MDVVVSVAEGLLRGREHDGVQSFKGIPYAAAPFGSARFAGPRPAPRWDGVRDATEYGPTAPKPSFPGVIAELLPEEFIQGEDCLNLNVWTPAADSARRPVLVWIHGGAFVYGSSAASAFDGSKFALDGVVCVTINYRLGVDGFALIDGAPANRGLLDQVAALRWVRDNIEGFGGDPDTVTVAGESAGAMSVTTLLTMPAATGLFRRAIAQSGAGHHVLLGAAAAEVSTAIAEELGVAPSVTGLAAVPIDDLIAGQVALTARIAAAPDPARWGDIARSLMPFQPVIDGEVLEGRPIDLIAGGAGTDIDVLIGSNADEYAFFLVPNGFIDLIDDNRLAAGLAIVVADPAATIAVYRAAMPGASPGELMSAAMGDFYFRVPAIRVAEARLGLSADTFVYQFGWPSPQFDGRLGACHALEVAFVFDNLDDPALRPLAGSAPPRVLANEMHAAWANFVKTGDPGWPAYGAERNVRSFTTPSETLSDPGAAQRRVWDGVR